LKTLPTFVMAANVKIDPRISQINADLLKSADQNLLKKAVAFLKKSSAKNFCKLYTGCFTVARHPTP